MTELFVKRGRRYVAAKPSQIAEAHLQYAAANARNHLPAIQSPGDSRQYLKEALAGQQSETFCCLFLDNRHRVISFRVMFRGTIDAAAVYPREIVRAALEENAAAVIVAHNHPSGIAEPSESDKLITRRVRDALELVDIRLLDHFIVGEGKPVSLASRGQL